MAINRSDTPLAETPEAKYGSVSYEGPGDKKKQAAKATDTTGTGAAKKLGAAIGKAVGAISNSKKSSAPSADRSMNYAEVKAAREKLAEPKASDKVKDALVKGGMALANTKKSSSSSDKTNQSMVKRAMDLANTMSSSKKVNDAMVKRGNNLANTKKSDSADAASTRKMLQDRLKEKAKKPDTAGIGKYLRGTNNLDLQYGDLMKRVMSSTSKAALKNTNKNKYKK